MACSAQTQSAHHSVRGELGAQNCRDVLTLTQQPDHIQVIVALEAEPQQREPCDLPGPKPRNAHRGKAPAPIAANLRTNPGGAGPTSRGRWSPQVRWGLHIHRSVSSNTRALPQWLRSAAIHAGSLRAVRVGEAPLLRDVCFAISGMSARGCAIGGALHSSSRTVLPHGFMNAA